ncbi:hypothetical protein DERP_009525 [Dermatophagoides pteronyssinus]|uniref:Uncharacterized protein n=1 Tax=Dermatophagoides pteronyssinus TaxID=6956 RepID=A0ABQ8IUE7_DERPT|nr:hypothetical protein DERP_009525 [Dermatophagoides pteronyssinus]
MKTPTTRQWLSLKQKKCCVVILTLIPIIWRLIVLIMVIANKNKADYLIIKVDHQSTWNIDLFSVIWLGFILVTVFSLIGLFGIIKEIYCLSITYSIYSCIQMISYFLAIFFVSTIYSILFIIYLALFITLIFIIMDLNQKNRTTNNDLTNKNSITNSSFPVF